MMSSTPGFCHKSAQRTSEFPWRVFDGARLSRTTASAWKQPEEGLSDLTTGSAAAAAVDDHKLRMTSRN